MARLSRVLVFAVVATTAGCSVLFGFDELLPGPANPVAETGTPDGTSLTDTGTDASCPTGFDDCTSAPGCETLVGGDDPNNCGACGRTCGGAACTSGACGPEVIATEDALTVAADDTGVYWSTAPVDAGADAEAEGEIVRATPDGGSRAVIAKASSPTNLGAIALDATHVYWGTSTDKIRRVPKNGGTIDSYDLPSVSGQITRLAVANDTVFASARAGTNAGRIDAIPLSGGTATTIAENQEQPYGIALGPQHVYWVANGSNRIWQTQQDGGAPVSIPSNGAQPLYLAADNERVYWTHTAAGNGLWAGTLPLTAGSRVVQLFDGSSVVGRGVVVDATYVYWSTDTGVDRIRKDGTKHTQVVHLPAGNTREIAIDDGWVYFVITSTSAPTRIGRTPK